MGRQGRLALDLGFSQVPTNLGSPHLPEKTLSPSATTRVGAYGLVLQGRRILLCRVAARIPEWGGFWTLPGGGIDFGEHPAEAMEREVREETGLRVRARGVAGIDSLVPPEDPSVHSLRILYFTELLGGELRNEIDGSTDLCRWHDVDQVPSLPIVGLVESGLSFLPRPVSPRTRSHEEPGT